MTIPRPEYPRPQFVRKDWLCLNGEWQFEIDNGDSGLERGLIQQCVHPHTIQAAAQERGTPTDKLDIKAIGVPKAG